MAALFDIKNVSFPSTIKTNTKFSVTGDVTLFGIPFYALLWVGVTITYPKSWWQILGASEVTSIAVAKFGKFNCDFNDGFSKEGDYTIDIRAWLGPTALESVGPLTSAVVTIPPLPNVIILPQKQFTVSGEGGSTTGQPTAFEVSNPTINPSTVEVGAQTVITLPVKNVGTNPQTFNVEIQVTETGWSDVAPPGSIVGDQTFGPFTLQPGNTQNVVMNWAASGASTGKWLVAKVLINNELAPNTTPNNPNIFKQQFEVISPVISFQLLNPVINPADVVSGAPTAITFDVVNNSTNAQAVKLHADITEIGWIDVAPPGSIVDSYDNQATIQPGQHWNPVWTWTAKGAITGKWIVLSLMDSSGKLEPNTGPNNPNIFKQEFQVESASAIASINLQQPVPSANPVNVGSQVTINVPFVLTSATTQTVKVTVTLQYAGSGTSSIDEATDSQIVTAQPGVTTTVPFTFTVDDGSNLGAIYSGGQNERKLKVDCWIAGNDIAGNVFAKVFYAKKITTPGNPALTISTPSVAQGGNLSFSFSGFHPNATVQILVVQTGGFLNVQADATGAGSGSFADNDPPGAYTLNASDSFGDTDSANFNITAVGPQVTVTSLNIPSQVAYGQTINAQVGFSFKGSAANLILEVSLGEKSWYGGAFSVESGMKYQQTISVATAISAVSKSGIVNMTIPNGVPAKLYDVLSRVLDQNGNELGSRIDGGMITIVSGGGGGGANLTASYAGGVLSFAFSGFQANAAVSIIVTQTGGGISKTADANGSGSGAFYDNDPAGAYTLKATDIYGHTASASFNKT